MHKSLNEANTLIWNFPNKKKIYDKIKYSKLTFAFNEKLKNCKSKDQTFLYAISTNPGSHAVALPGSQKSHVLVANYTD